jgi:hypothetical protein
MKKVILLVWFMPMLAYGQIVENFENGNLTGWRQYPDGRWKADTSESISGRYSLHHDFDNQDSGTDEAAMPIDSLHPSEGAVKWSFSLRHGYDPSSSNCWSLFLMSDGDSSTVFRDGSTSGFAVGVNLTGTDDTLRLWKFDGSTITSVVKSSLNWQTGIGTTEAAKVIVARETDGRWSISVYRATGELLSTATGRDSELFPCRWLKLRYRYSSTKDRLLWFDDLLIDGVFHKDTTLTSVPATAGTGDVEISEIMADPEPVVNLPAEEYIEITNRTKNSFDLKNWKISSGDQDYPFPDALLDPEEIMIICSIQDTSKFSVYGKVTGLKQYPALTDNGKMLMLYDSGDKLIHGVEYSSLWYRDEMKSKGGWSLEMIDTGYPFFFSENWTASRSRSGGTPGKRNSVAGDNPDNSFSGYLNVFPEDSANITITSPEPLFGLISVADSIDIEGKSLQAIAVDDPLFRQFRIKLNDPLPQRKICQLNIRGRVRDFPGNILQKDNYSFGIPEPAVPGDILFNELLFNPLPGDPDYIEIYNASDKVIDASRLEIVSVNDDSGDTSLIYSISDEHRCFLPHTYYALTTDKTRVADRYFSSDTECLFEIGSLPSMPDDRGHLILFCRELVKIDEIAYSEKMQSSLLSGNEGVALERISQKNEPVPEGNWHSASESSGWGTPGARNSVSCEMPSARDQVTLSSTRISPDDDGIEDFLKINFNLNGISNIISVTIFDESGNYVRKVAGNLYAGREASLTWDGTADDGSPVGTGIYIVYITLFDESGKTQKWKRVCTVIRR